MKKTIIALTLAAGVLAIGCRKEGCTDVEATNYDMDAKKDDGSCQYDNSYDIPNTYVFTDADGNSTVSFTGQKQRLDMLSEMTAYLKTGNTKGTTLDATQLKNMFANDGYTWEDNDNLDMNNSSKQLKNKCAGGDATITDMFESYMDSVAALSALNQDGSPGTGGVYPDDGTKGPYLMDANGLEYTQWIEKGLMGAVFYYQMTNVYLAGGKMDVDNTTAKDPENGKYYTAMEHHWDEAFGYFTSETDYPANGTDRFWGKYAASFEDDIQSQTKIMEAFLKGRAAIANDDMTTRDEQIEIIRDEMERLVAACGIHYLNSAVNNISKTTTRNHALSEATAFIKDLQYGYNATEENSITKAQIDNILNTIGEDYNNVTAADLQTARDELSSIIGLDDVKDQL